MTARERIQRMVPRKAIDLLKGVRTIARRIRKADRMKYGGEYILIENADRDELERAYSKAWTAPSLPSEQLKVITRTHSNDPAAEPMRTAIELIRKTGLTAPHLLEIGCSTGHYADVFQRAGLNVRYEGVDYSEAFIAEAKRLHPQLAFKQGDTTALPYPDKYFDIAFSSACILHVIRYEKAIAETARVSNALAIFHRTPVIMNRPTSFCKKIGYGVEMVEVLFNENELIDLFKQNGLEVIATAETSRFDVKGLGEPVIMKSYLCRRSVSI